MTSSPYRDRWWRDAEGVERWRESAGRCVGHLAVRAVARNSIPCLPSDWANTLDAIPDSTAGARRGLCCERNRGGGRCSPWGGHRGLRSSLKGQAPQTPAPPISGHSLPTIRSWISNLWSRCWLSSTRWPACRSSFISRTTSRLNSAAGRSG